MDADESRQPSAEPLMHAGSPFAEEPIVTEPIMAEAAEVEREEPRLGIMHLLVWTACVAVYFSFLRTLSQVEGAPTLSFLTTDVLSVPLGLGMGTALAGLVLLVSRRLRGFPLARHPGEYMLLLFGVSSVSSAATYTIVAHFQPGRLGGTSWTQYVFIATALGVLVINGLILLVALVRVKILRWRIFFAVVMMTAVLQRILPVVVSMAGFFGTRLLVTVLQLVPLITVLALIVVVVMDLHQRKRYPWQHWLGVGLQFWFGAFNVGWLVYYLLQGIGSF